MLPLLHFKVELKSFTRALTWLDVEQLHDDQIPAHELAAPATENLGLPRDCYFSAIDAGARAAAAILAAAATTASAIFNLDASLVLR